MTHTDVAGGFAKDSTLLGTGMAVSGLLAYAYIVLGTRVLGAEGFAPVSVLWTFWAVTAAFITFPVQHWIIRTIEVDGHTGRVRDGVTGLVYVTLITVVITASVAWLGRGQLFGRGDPVFPVLAAAVPVGSVLMGVTRGVLAGRHRFVTTALVLAGENAGRFAAALFVAMMGGGVVSFGFALVAGFAIAAATPSAFDLGPGTGRGAGSLPVIGAVSVASLLAQFILAGGPLVVALGGGSAAHITALFSALALYRAPYIVATGVGARVTGSLTRLMTERRWGDLRRLRGWLMGLSVGGGVAALGFGFWVGPTLLRLVFGSDVELSSWDMGLLAAGNTLALGALFATLLMIAQDRSSLLLVGWLSALLAASLAVAVLPGDIVSRVSWGVLVGHLVAVILLVAFAADLEREPSGV